MYKIVIVGEKEDILPYQSIGVEIEPVKTVADTLVVLRKVAQRPDVGMILITENMAEHCLDTITELRSRTSVAITIIPTEQGSRHTSTMDINKEIARSVGMDIFANEYLGYVRNI